MTLQTNKVYPSSVIINKLNHPETKMYSFILANDLLMNYSNTKTIYYDNNINMRNFAHTVLTADSIQ
jgi:hypothetical protein